MNTFNTKLLTIVAGFAICAMALPAQADSRGHDRDRDGNRNHDRGRDHDRRSGNGWNFDISIILGGGRPRYEPAPRCEPPVCTPPIIVQPPVIVVPAPCPPAPAPIDVTVNETAVVRVPYTYYEDVRVEVPVYERVRDCGRIVVRQVGTRCEWRSVQRTGYRNETRIVPRTYRAYWDECKRAYVYTDSCGVQQTVCR